MVFLMSMDIAVFLGCEPAKMIDSEHGRLAVVEARYLPVQTPDGFYLTWKLDEELLRTEK